MKVIIYINIQFTRIPMTGFKSVVYIAERIFLSIRKYILYIRKGNRIGRNKFL